VLAPKISKPARSTKPLTLPDDVELATSKRAARGAKPGDQARQRDGGGRRGSPAASSGPACRAAPLGAAVFLPPVRARASEKRALPHHTHKRTRAQRSVHARPHPPHPQAPAASPFRSLAEKVLDFQSRTPPRFRVAPKAGAAAAAPGTAPGSRGASGGGASRGRARPQQPPQPQITEAKVGLVWLLAPAPQRAR
jgi:hypothetical protein